MYSTPYDNTSNTLCHMNNVLITTSATSAPAPISATTHFLGRMEVASSRPHHLPTLSITKTSELSLLVKSLLMAERSMPALLLRLLLQCYGDIEMNRGPVSTPTPTNCLRLMQWNANGISGKITLLQTFLHSNNANIAAIQETKLTNKSKSLHQLLESGLVTLC